MEYTPRRPEVVWASLIGLGSCGGNPDPDVLHLESGPLHIVCISQTVACL